MLTRDGPRHRLRFFAWAALIDIAAFSTLNLYFATTTFLLTPSERGVSWSDLFFEHLLAWMVWAGLTPALFWISKHVRMGRGRGAMPTFQHLGLSVAALAVYALVLLGLGALESGQGLAYFSTLPANKAIYFLLDYQWYWWITLAAHGYHGNRDAIAQAREAEALKTKTAELSGRLIRAELDTLKAQLQPHFLFNTHNAIAGLIRSGQDTAALELLAALSDFLRYTLENRERTAVPLARELSFVHKYLDIQKIRFQDRLHLEWEIEPGCESLLVPPLLLQPLVENAVHHGVSSRRDHNLVRVRAARCEDGLEVEIVNSSGRELRDHEGFGVGLENVHGRLERLYGADYALEIDLLDAPEGQLMRLRMRLPIEHDQD